MYFFSFNSHHLVSLQLLVINQQVLKSIKSWLIVPDNFELSLELS